MREILEVPFEFDRDTFNRWIRLERYLPMKGELEELLSLVLPLVKPRLLIREAAIDSCTDRDVHIGGQVFNSPVLAWNLRQTDRIWAYVITCGREIFQRLQEEDDPLKQYWIDALAELAVQFASSRLEAFLKERTGERVTGEQLTFMNPGSADRDVWPLEDQKALFSLLGDVESAIGVTLTEGCLMQPSKSLSGFYFLSPKGFVSCWVCSRTPCKTRQAAYRPEFSSQLPPLC